MNLFVEIFQKFPKNNFFGLFFQNNYFKNTCSQGWTNCTPDADRALGCAKHCAQLFDGAHFALCEKKKHYI